MTAEDLQKEFSKTDRCVSVKYDDTKYYTDVYVEWLQQKIIDLLAKKEKT